MTILHAIARTMMASYFVVNGIKSLRHPDANPEELAALSDRIMPLMRAVLPKVVMDRLPEDEVALTKVCGIMQIGGGAALATGLGRRTGALALAGTMVPAVVAANPFQGAPEERDQRAAKLAVNVALLGGTLLAAQDTQGKPSLAWRAKLRREALAEDAAKRKAAAKKSARSAA